MKQTPSNNDHTCTLPGVEQHLSDTFNRWHSGVCLKLAKVLLIATTLTVTAAMAKDSECDCEQKNIYPTHVIADYVLGCMAANGNSFESLHQCSCSIDLIMSKVSLEDYEKASTILQVQLDKGQRGIFYRDSHWAKNKLETFERVQAESTLKCF